MFIAENSIYAFWLITIALAVVVAASIILAEIQYLLIFLLVSIVGVVAFAAVTWLGLEPIAQLVPWLVLGYIFMEVILPLVLAYLPDIHWLESDKDRDIHRSHENAVQYPDNVILFPKGEEI